MPYQDLMKTKNVLDIQGRQISYFDLNKLNAPGLGDISTLADPDVVDELIKGMQ